MNKYHIQGGLAAILLIIIVVVGALLSKSLLIGSTSPTTRESQLIILINKYRVSHHLHTLTLSAGLRTAAREHSRDMLANDYFDHRGFPQRVRKHVHSNYLGENIAWGTSGFGEPSGVLSLWRSSPPHKKILLTPSFRKVGIGIVNGVYFDQKGATITTADFSS